MSGKAEAEVTALRFAYADPPYVGCAHYYDHPNSARWDHPSSHIFLMSDMEQDYDGWALSCSATSLPDLLADAPRGTRVGAWVKPFAAFKRNVRVAYTWEPVLFHRIAPRRDGEPVGRDHLSEGITMRRGFTGAKPARFADWLRILLGYMEGDELVDLFPGSGAITRQFDVPRLAL